MASQIYLKNTVKFLSYMMDETANVTKEVFLGDSYSFYPLYDPNNAFSSLGGSKENPLEYTFQGTGITQFHFNLYGLNNTAFAKRKLYIQGNKINELYFESQINEIILSTCSVYATKGQKTNFKLLITSQSFEIRSIDHYFDGSQNEIKSSITAKFIADPVVEESNEPITITQDAQLTLNRRHIVKAPSGKILQLSMPDHKKIKKGNWIEVKNMDLGNFQINPGDNIDIMLNSYVTRDKSGYIRSKKRGDFVRLECMEISPRIILANTNTIGTFGILQ